MSDNKGEITRWLDAWSDGEPEALDRLMPLVFDELRLIARRYFQPQDGERTLQPTALVNEVYIRLQGLKTVRWTDSRHFFGTMAGMLRHRSVDADRRRLALKRGRDHPKVSLDETLPAAILDGELVALDDGLKWLESVDPRKHEIVVLKFFVGLTLDEIATVLGVARSTVIKDWKNARLWLLRFLDKTSDEETKDPAKDST